MSTKILAFAGSTRAGSFNKKLCTAASAALREAGSEVTQIDLRDYPMPLYDGDAEAAEGLPANARKLKELFLAHRALLLACPEYNSGPSAVLKNAIDWVSRPVPGEPSLAGFTGKVAWLVSASTGVLGGLRGLVIVRSILSNIGVLVLPEQVTVPQAASAFAENGALKEEALRQRLARGAARLVDVTRRLAT